MAPKVRAEQKCASGYWELLGNILVHVKTLTFLLTCILGKGCNTIHDMFHNWPTTLGRIKVRLDKQSHNWSDLTNKAIIVKTKV